MQFRDIIGQEELKRRLVASVAAGRVSHAQLFTGAAGAGTLPLAVAYAQYLNCRHRADGDLGAMSMEDFTALLKDVVDSKAKK